MNFKKIKLERFAQLKYVIHKFTVLGKKNWITRINLPAAGTVASVNTKSGHYGHDYICCRLYIYGCDFSSFWNKCSLYCEIKLTWLGIEKSMRNQNYATKQRHKIDLYLHISVISAILLQPKIGSMSGVVSKVRFGLKSL